MTTRPEDDDLLKKLMSVRWPLAPDTDPPKMVPDDDAIYQDGGFLWHFVIDLNPHIKKKEKGPR